VRQDRAELVAWVAGNVVPHESAVRDKLRSVGVPEYEIDDIMQDAYLRISHLDSVAHIRNGRGYLFTVARSAMLLRVRRERIVRIDSLSDYDELTLADDDPGPERHAAARIDLERVHRMIASLPSPCREIFEMRRIEGVPQREIAARMGVSEHIVEKLSARGLRLILKAIAGGNREAASPAKQRIERKLRDVGFE
jgi:RNA polymerase sigma factor (sigma-70 family)